MAITQDQISTLYRNILGRDADQEGLEFWSNANMDAGDIEKQFRSSNEATDNINREYQSYLYRDADQEGLEFWRSNLGMGFGYDNLRSELAGSDEYQRYVNPIQMAYNTFLGQSTPDSAGMNFWVNNYRSDGNEDRVVNSFVPQGSFDPIGMQTSNPNQYSAYSSTLDAFGMDPMSLSITPQAAAENWQWTPDTDYSTVTWDRLSQADRDRIIATMYGEESQGPDSAIAQSIRNSMAYGDRRWQGHKPLGDTVLDVTRGDRYNANKVGDTSYENNTSKMNPNHPLYGAYNDAARAVFENKDPIHKYAYYSKQSALPGSSAWEQFQGDSARGAGSDSTDVFGRHTYFYELPTEGIFTPAPMPVPRPNFEAQAAEQASAFPLSIGGSFDTPQNPAGGDFQPIGDISPLPIFAFGVQDFGYGNGFQQASPGISYNYFDSPAALPSFPLSLNTFGGSGPGGIQPIGPNTGSLPIIASGLMPIDNAGGFTIGPSIGSGFPMGLGFGGPADSGYGGSSPADTFGAFGSAY